MPLVGKDTSDMRGPATVAYRAGRVGKKGYLTRDDCVLDEDFRLVGTVVLAGKLWMPVGDPEAFNGKPPAPSRGFAERAAAAKWLLEAREIRLGL